MRRRILTNLSEYGFRPLEELVEGGIVAESEFDIVLGFHGQLEQYVPDEAWHQVFVGMATTILAVRLGIVGEDLRRVSLAAYLHDIGKLEVPAWVLKASPAEVRARFEEFWMYIYQHPVTGARMLREKGMDDIACIVEGHHAYQLSNAYPLLSELSPPPEDMTARTVKRLTLLVSFCDCYHARLSRDDISGEVTAAELRQYLMRAFPGYGWLIERLFAEELLPTQPMPKPEAREFEAAGVLS